MRSDRHKATSPSRNWSPAGDRSLAGRGPQLATGPLQHGVASWRPVPCKTRSQLVAIWRPSFINFARPT
ncbi:hypothetical protein Bca52824_057947 [Brassica carinata]|uniref:Uncharacterized protein n=1 Tax=Brassica carinata TaxID=52824 RepID=A0A8X7QS72_BRACI|nr:hypothetical protein Bca52824_057947 [Brassica carinata]